MTTIDLARLKQSIDQALATLLPQDSAIAPELVAAMRYATLGGGKRLRPMFLCATCTALGGDEAKAMPAACAVEFIHSYSLAHDDLPAMDDDDIRHGQPASHIAYGEATAILAGDALLTLAFELLTQLPDVDADTSIACVSTLSRAAGWAGMVGGQTRDMALSEPSAPPADHAQLNELHAAKSGALIRAAVSMGARIGGADEEVRTALERIADQVGLAFQIKDDVLDATASTQTLGKPAGSDEEENKQTYVRLMGVDAADWEADALLEQALTALSQLPLAHDGLQQLAVRAVRRDF